ncbi:hypothetical protein DYQ86_01125 [Acidobacteria bacterium AB60]|nr:hypothetical protein DYQ86_01125 [Acidobacteria bacterium AB60]
MLLAEFSRAAFAGFMRRILAGLNRTRCVCNRTKPLLAVPDRMPLGHAEGSYRRGEAAMNARVYRSLLFVGALLVPQLGGAQLQIPTQAFGKMESVLDFCAKNAPQNTAKFDELKKKLAAALPEDQIADLRKTEEYKDAYDQEKTELAKMSKEKAAKTCSASLEQK